MAQWKVYREEWTVAYTSPGRGEVGKQQAESYLNDHYPALDPSKVRLQSSSTATPDWPWYVMVCVPVLKAHFSNRERAQQYADEVGGTLVEADSEAEDALQ